jgi:hypothetical protein
MKSPRREPWSGLQRAQDGFIATLVDLDTGRTETIVRGGLVHHRPKPEKILVGNYDMLRELALELDERPGRWRIRTISSPATILNDLTVGVDRDQQPEWLLMGRIGRPDLLERSG